MFFLFRCFHFFSSLKYRFTQLKILMSPLQQRPPFRAEHLGSLLRPKQLIEERAAIDKKEITEKEIEPIEDESIKAIVNDQIKLGFRAVSDGEYRRHMFWYATLVFH